MRRDSVKYWEPSHAPSILPVSVLLGTTSSKDQGQSETGVLPPSPNPAAHELVTHSDDVQDAQEAVDTVSRDHLLHDTLLPILRHRDH